MIVAYLEVLSNFTNEALEGELANKEIRALLVLADFTESDGTRPEAVRLLDTTSRDLFIHRNFRNAVNKEIKIFTQGSQT